MRRYYLRLGHFYNDNIRYKHYLKMLEGPIKKVPYNKRRLICSITTIPQRIEFIHYPILSMLHQEITPDIIVLYLGKEQFRNVILPKSVTALQENGLIIKYVDDVMVHTKYFYAFQEYPDDLVMTVDDDIIYDNALTKKLLDMHEKFSEAVVCSRAHKMTFVNNAIKPYFKWDWEYKSNKPDMLLVATGVGGVLYEPRNFRISPCDKDLFLKLSPKNDDLWLKAIEFVNEMKVVTIPGNHWWTEIKDSQSASLNSTNVHEHRNDEYIRNLSNYFEMNRDSLVKY